MKGRTDLTVDVDESRGQKVLNNLVMTRLCCEVETGEPLHILGGAEISVNVCDPSKVPYIPVVCITLCEALAPALSRYVTVSM